MGILRRRGSLTKARYQSVEELFQDYEVPSFSGVASEVLSMLSDPSIELPAIAQVINLDPGTSVSVLRLVNSAAVGFSRPVGSVQQAVVLLGRNQIESLLVCRAVGQALPRPASAGFDNRRFWLASAQRASIASALAEIVEPARQSEIFTAALLQDMAIPVMCERLDGYSDLHTEWVQGAITDLDEVEEERFGRSHEDVGAWMSTQWALPSDLVDLIDDHHHDDRDEHLTAYLVAGWDLAGGVDQREQVIARSHARSGLDEDRVDAAITTALTEAHGIAELFY
ncbi:MAG: HDOD domain-containing protein [Actinomycetia bacterium]|nr:HDOD domain-containing protein [Actinomycetes bacterium]